MLRFSKSITGCMQGTDAMERYFTVAKRIALFLARTSSQHTIDHLVYEISRQISEDENTVPATSSDIGVIKAKCNKFCTSLCLQAQTFMTFCGYFAQHSSVRHLHGLAFCSASSGLPRICSIVISVTTKVSWMACEVLYCQCVQQSLLAQSVFSKSAEYALA